MNFSENLQLALQLIPPEFVNTLLMVFISGFFAALIGLPIGIVLYFTGRGGLKENVWAHKGLEAVVNVGRSIPFAILIVALIPLTRLIVGTSLGTIASIVPLTIAAAPFFARLVERALKEVDHGMVEAAIVMGSTPQEITLRVLLPEAFPSLVSAMTVTLVNLVGYSAMAGLVGGGGLGKIAIQYGYQRFNGFLMIATLVILLFLVEGIEQLGKKIVFRLEKVRKRG